MYHKIAGVIIPLLLSLYGCDSGTKTAPSDPPRNLFENPSFESGREPWFSLDPRRSPSWADFQVAEAVARSGERSAMLSLRSADYDGNVRVYGVIQELDGLQTLPRRLSGWYRVENWVQGTEKQYLQAVIIVWGARNAVSEVAKKAPLQIAYVFGGINAAPFAIGNRRFFLPRTKEVQQHRWIHFDRDLHEDFLNMWGFVPEAFSKVRVLFEVRFDDREANENEAAADVYYDDLYFGD